MPDDRLIGRQLGGFEVVALIGSGAFASVYRAVQLGLDRDVALKVLDPALARLPDAARRFIGEGQKAATLDHPAIVPVFAAGDLDGLLYLAMRLVPGCSLADELATSGPLTDDRLVHVVTALTGALDHAHDRGIVHRDVKPANILVDGDRVWLTDFGIAATMQEAGRYTTGALGTAAYMAPEQIRPALGEIDGRADLYALGCVIYECVTGRPPYLADDLVALLYAQAQQAIPSTGRVAIDAFMLRALAKNAADRFPSGEALLAGLREALAGHILAPVSGGSTVPIAPPRRHPAWRRRVGGLTAVAAAVGASYLLTHRHPTSAAGALSTLKPSLVGPKRISDPNGATYRLLAGWSVEGVNPAAGATTTALDGHGRRLAEVTVESHRAETADDLARRAGCSSPVAILFGGVTGRFCQLNGTAWDGGGHPTVFNGYFANVKGQSWTVLVADGVPGAELFTFRDSFSFEG